MLTRNGFRTLLLSGIALVAVPALAADTVIVNVVPNMPAASYGVVPRYDPVTTPTYNVTPTYNIVTVPQYDAVTARPYLEPTSSAWVPGYWSWSEARHRNEWHEGRYVVFDRRDYAYPPYWYGVPDYPVAYSYLTPDFRFNTYASGNALPPAHWEGGR